MNVKDLLTLDDDKEYTIVSKATFDGNLYLYLIDINDNKNLKICAVKQDNEGYLLDEIEDSESIQKLLPLFCESSKDMINELFNNLKESTEN